MHQIPPNIPEDNAQVIRARPRKEIAGNETAFAAYFQVNSFRIEDSFYRSRLPRSTHWSVAWSDLMMTMFILFLSMFVYQAAHEDFLVNKTPEVIGGSTTEALDVEADQGIINPIVPINRTLPLMTSGTVKKVEEITLDEINFDNLSEQALVVPDTNIHEEEQIPAMASEEKAEKDILEPEPIIIPQAKESDREKRKDFEDIYTSGQRTLDENSLDKFASLELIPDKTMRIILTGDLLFQPGLADISQKARDSLLEIAGVIKDTPYMVNVVGHTDNTPMNSNAFASNWELSVIRASRVARFLIDNVNMNPAQFIVSGYGSQRPIRANDNSENRAVNRRVEIIISKRLPPAVKASPKNIQ